MSTPASVPWVIPSIDDLKNVLCSPAVEAYRTKSLGTGQPDPFDDVMATVTNRIRAEINRYQVTSLTENAIPPSLLRIACLMIAKSMESRLPGIKLTENQDDERKEGIRYLERINRNDVQVEYPDDPMVNTVIQIASVAELVTCNTRVSTRHTMAGL